MKDDIRARIQREQLHHAARAGNLRRVDELLERKYPTNRFDEIGKTPLHYAVSGGHLEIVDRLLRAGANVNANDEHHIGNTPLADHIEKYSLEMVKRLIAAGADPTIPGWMGLTALDRADDRDDLDASKIRVLLKGAVKRPKRK